MKTTRTFYNPLTVTGRSSAQRNSRTSRRGFRILSLIIGLLAGSVSIPGQQPPATTNNQSDLATASEKSRESLKKTKLTVTANPTKGGSVKGSGQYAAGTMVTITATPKKGWRFTGWNDNTPAPARTVTVPATNMTYTASFALIPTAKIVVNAATTKGGSVKGGGQYAVGTTITITATPKKGWLFTGWSDGAMAATHTMTVPATNTTYTANFSLAGSCLYTIVPPTQTLAATAGTGSVTVATAGTCAWTATSLASWITITTGSSGSGTGTVNYTVAANAVTNSRSGNLIIAGRTVTVTQQAGSRPISISAISNTSPLPLTTLSLATTGIATNDSITVTFANNTGFSLSSTPIRIAADGTVVVAVPLYADPGTSTVTNGTVALVLTHGNQVSAPVSIDIQNLPTLAGYGVQPGEVSHAFLVFRALLLGSRLGQFQAATLLFGTDTSGAQSTLSSNLTAVLLARHDVDRVLLDNSTVITNGALANGTTIQWDLNSQTMMDRILAVYLLQQFGSATATVARASRPTAHTAAATTELQDILKVIKDWRTAPDLIRGLQKSENDLDAAEAAFKAGLGYIGDSVGAAIGEKELESKLGAALSILDIGRAAVDASYDLGALYLDSKYGGDPIALAEDMANLNKDQVKLFDASISALSLGFIEGVKAGTPGSITIMGLGLAFSDAQLLQTLAGLNADETALSVAGQMRNPFPSPNHGFGLITVTVPGQNAQDVTAVQDSISLCCLGAGDLGIQGMADPGGYADLFVPLGVAGTDYTSLTLSAGDFTTGTTTDSETANLSSLTTSQVFPLPTPTPYWKYCACYFDTSSSNVNNWVWRCHGTNTELPAPYLNSPGPCVCDPALYQVCQ